MAEALGVAASIATFVDISVKVASLCMDYAKKVQHAEEDIKRLRVKIEGLAQLAKDVQQQIESDKGGHLSTSQKLKQAVSECCSQIESVQKKLEPSTRRKFMGGMGFRLKWPFESKDFDKIIRDLEKCNVDISLALQLDNTRIVLDISKQIDLGKIPSAPGAAFDAYSNERHELDARCHPDTRKDLLRQIKMWAKDPQGKSIFWLNGVAGTGKSTISRTVAQSFDDKGLLGASFFFKRGENERQNTSKFFSTITTQLLRKIPDIIPQVRKAIDEEPEIAAKTLEKQFDSLIFQPLSKLDRGSTVSILPLVLVVDALDECDGDRDIKTILRLLARVRDLKTVQMRVFLTSRPELPIRLGFHNMTTGTHESIVLQDIPIPTIEHDISVFLKEAFSKIRSDFNSENSSQIPRDWPDNRSIERLTKMAVPLFIFAATICRFVGDTSDWNPKKRLATILEDEAIRGASQLDQTYLPVLKQFETRQPKSQFKKFGEEFRKIIGSIVLLADPLSTNSLASLLGISKLEIDAKLHRLHSVLSVPSDSKLPVRLLHLSFREFLVRSKETDEFWFQVDEEQTHSMITARCLGLLSESLKENMCSIRHPGTRRSEVDIAKIDEFLPEHLRYSCRYWVHHLKHSNERIYSNDAVHTFLRHYFLNWLEALSLLGKISDSIGFINTLQSLVDENHGSEVLCFLYDAGRFILQNRWIINEAPLQLYSSALIFSPQKSVVRTTFQNCIPKWIRRLPETSETWGAELQKLQEYDGFVKAAAFFSDGRLISASRGGGLFFWDTTTGEKIKALKPDSDRNGEGKAVIAISPDEFVAQALYLGMIVLWDPETEEIIRTFEGHGYSYTVNEIAFSTDGRLASASDDKTVRIWDVATGNMLKVFEHCDGVSTIAFSPDGELASAETSGTIRLRNMETGEITMELLRAHGSLVSSLAFSSVYKFKLASASWDRTVRIWNLAAGQQIQKFEHKSPIHSICFLPAGGLASGSDDGTISIWNTVEGKLVKRLRGHKGAINAVAFSDANMRLASASDDYTVRLWDVTEVEDSVFRGYPDSTNIKWLTVSSDNRYVAISESWTTRIWDTVTADEAGRLEGFLFGGPPTFSSDSKQLALVVLSFSYPCPSRLGTVITIWNIATGSREVYSEENREVRFIAFSPDGKRLASLSESSVVVWDLATKEKFNRLEGRFHAEKQISFSPDGKTLVLFSSKSPSIILWDTETGKEESPFEGRLKPSRVRSIIFLSRGLLAVLVADGPSMAVQIWDTNTDEQVKSLKTPAHLQSLRYTAETGCLESNKGVLDVFPTEQMKLNLKQKSEYIFLKGDWVTRDGRDLLWLPPDYRSAHSFVKGNFLVIARNPSAISIYEFAFS